MYRSTDCTFKVCAMPPTQLRNHHSVPRIRDSVGCGLWDVSACAWQLASCHDHNLTSPPERDAGIRSIFHADGLAAKGEALQQNVCRVGCVMMSQ